VDGTEGDLVVGAGLARFEGAEQCVEAVQTASASTSVFADAARMASIVAGTDSANTTS
jgi:hypothetical protein